MKTKEELLKIYSAYLPYDLTIKLLERIDSTFICIAGLTEKGILRIGDSGHHLWEENFEKVKPILYSMDMLTKEIEHKGERFIPINKLKHFYGWDYLWSYHQKPNGDFNIKSVRYACIEKLLEWHLNVFGLDESEYIKKESLS
jgi:hypothetical protein